MGSVQSQKNNLENYIQVPGKRFDERQFYRSKTNATTLMLKKLDMITEEDYRSQLRIITIRKALKCSHLINLEQLWQEKKQQHCSTTTSTSLMMLIEYPFLSLQDLIYEKREFTKESFSEDQLWSILYSCSFALNVLYENKLTHEALNSRQILIDQEGIIKLADPILTRSETNFQVASKIKINDKRYLSPQIQQALNLQKPFHHYLQSKSDVYILGLILLETCCINTFNPNLSHQNLSNYWMYLNKYSKDFQQLIKKMLDIIPQQRPSFQNILSFIQERADVLGNQPNKINLTISHISNVPFNQGLNQEIKSTHSSFRYGPQYERQNQRIKNTSLKSYSVLNLHQKNKTKQPLTENPIFKSVQMSQKNFNYRTNQHSTLQKQLGKIKIGYSYGKTPYDRKPSFGSNSLKSESFVIRDFAQKIPNFATFNNDQQMIKTQPQHFKSAFSRYKQDSIIQQIQSITKEKNHRKNFIQLKGEWKQNLFTGQGIEINSNKQTFYGELDYSDLREIKIKYKWASFNGQFVKNIRQGYGVLSFTNGQTFQGTFANNLIQGKGSFLIINGTIFQGQWRNSLLIKQ